MYDIILKKIANSSKSMENFDIEMKIMLLLKA